MVALEFAPIKQGFVDRWSLAVCNFGGFKFGRFNHGSGPAQKTHEEADDSSWHSEGLQSSGGGIQPMVD